MNKQRLFVASCISIATASMVFAIRGDVAGPLSQAFHITNEQMGLVFSPAFWAFTIAIFISGNLVDIVGMRRLHIMSAVGFIVGVALVVLAPHPTEPVVSLFDHTGTTLLYAGFFMLGLSHGLVEGVINPLMASLYPDEKTRRITSVHAWWPAGLIIGSDEQSGNRVAAEAELDPRAGRCVSRDGALGQIPQDRTRDVQRVDGEHVE
jgi:MFS family permease